MPAIEDDWAQSAVKMEVQPVPIFVGTFLFSTL
ncbi:hypothetical protein AU14_02070 [Marinobacter similis]|uniref:Uncharacterized protein n=1 Tax=Marinobacter similis TaxID=1420916 RepID=W5YLP4_9GAMM|nr:hypothetical protein AU14_02070 [Marinobacter similis]